MAVEKPMKLNTNTPKIIPQYPAPKQTHTPGVLDPTPDYVVTNTDRTKLNDIACAVRDEANAGMEARRLASEADLAGKARQGFGKVGTSMGVDNSKKGGAVGGEQLKTDNSESSGTTDPFYPKPEK